MTHTSIARCLKDQNAPTGDLKSAISLDISERKLDHLSNDDFKLCPNLKDLDISCNNLAEIPNLNLLKLEELDCSNNYLESVEFVAQFPALKTLGVSGNPKLKVADKYIAATLCPQLMEVDVGTADINLQKSVKKLTEKLRLHVEGVWDALYAQKYSEGINGENKDVLYQEFLENIFSQKDVFMVAELKKFDKFMIKRLATALMDRVESGNFSRSRRSVIAKKVHSPTKRSPQGIDKPIKTQTPKRHSDVASIKDTPLRECLTKDLERENVSPKKTQRVVKRKRTTDCVKLPPVADYDRTHTLRCHSLNNDPQDSTTKVWCCAFEPAISSPGETTDIVATCGGNIVCLIDCRTGRVMKRYKDSSPDANFFTLAWSTLETSGKSGRTNILAVAGQDKLIRLLHPTQLVVYAALTGHTQYVSCLQFHPHTPNHLFSGADDCKVILWDLGPTDLESYNSRHKILKVMRCPRASITAILYSAEQQFLLVGTEQGLYAWNMSQLENSKSSRCPSIVFALPNMNINQSIDGITHIAKDLVAVKCTEQSEVIVFYLNQYLPSRLKSTLQRLPVYDYASLDYAPVAQPYINVSSSNGLLCVGDDKCNIHLYNLKSVAKKGNFPAALLTQSKILHHPMAETPDDEDFIINALGQSSGNAYVVCGTDNNLIYIWKRHTDI